MERIDRWAARKKASLQAKVKEKTEGLKRKEQEEKDHHEKLQEGREAAERWRKERVKEVVRVHKIATKRKQEEDRKKDEEAEQKEVESKSAFKSW